MLQDGPFGWDYTTHTRVLLEEARSAVNWIFIRIFWEYVVSPLFGRYGRVVYTRFKTN